MSRYVAALVYRKQVGSMARKAILAYCAERANDDGSGIWASKVTIAKEVECTKKTVIDTMKTFVDEGILALVGKKKISNGFVHVYNINLPAVEALKDAISDEELRGVILNPSPDYTPRGVTSTPQEVYSLHPNRPRTVLKPSKPQTPEGPSLFSANIETEHKDDTSALFDRFWKEYPKKAGKEPARKAFTKAIKREVPEKIIRGARAYSDWLKNPKPGEFRPHPKNAQGWLNDSRWNDEELQPSQRSSKYADLIKDYS